MMRPAVGEVVEQIDKGDLPCMVIEVHEKPHPQPWRFDLEAIDSTIFRNIPDYMLVAARRDSKWRNA